MAFPTYTKTYHSTAYPVISPTRKELSTAGKVVLITGGGTGIGSRTAHAFAASGSTSIAIVGRTESSLLSTKKAIEAEYPGTKVLALVADIVNQSAVNAAFAETKSTLGPIDVLVSNAGYMPAGAPIGTANVDEWFKGIEVNVKGNLIVAQAFLANAAKNPVFINISAAGAHIQALPVPLSAYSVGKTAVVKLLDYFAAENTHVRVIHVHPGAIETNMSKTAKEAGLVLPFDDVELPASFLVWVASSEAEFLKNKYVWANWDVDELKAKKEELVSSPQLTVGLLGWP